MADIWALSPLDGRYRESLGGLRQCFSEGALNLARLQVELAWLRVLVEHLPCSQTDRRVIREFSLSEIAVVEVKEVEERTQHDIKAVEYVLAAQLRQQGLSPAGIALIHFACTSEDINNLAYGMLLLRAKETVVLPSLKALLEDLAGAIRRDKGVPMLGHTHGQPASPTTMAKEWAVFAQRLLQVYYRVRDFKFQGKFNGAVGNYNAHCLVLPDLDWPAISKGLVESLGLEWTGISTQVESRDRLAAFCSLLAGGQRIAFDLSQDLWLYTSKAYLRLKSVATEVGSSTMPHKVNPIHFENAEGQLGLAHSLAEHLAAKLPVSRLQRDLSDSTVLRNLGVMFGHQELGLRSLSKGIGRCEANREKVRFDLEQNPGVLGEAVQTALRLGGDDGAYERLKDFSRGRERSLAEWREFIAGLDLELEVRQRLLELEPGGYVGLAEELAEEVLAELVEALSS